LQELKSVRRTLASAEGVPAFVVLSDASLEELATYLPLTLNDLVNIAGFGEIKIRKYGNAFLEALVKFSMDHNVETKMHLKAPKIIRRENVEQDTSTKQLTLKLFTEGLTIAQIADQRKLSLSTIEGHIAFYIKAGRISVRQVMDEDRLNTIKKTVQSVGDKTLTPIKLALGDNYSYSEIRYVIAYMQSGNVQEPVSAYHCEGERHTHMAFEERVQYGFAAA
jgi:ATP-dependent DNA helicase RecQ